MPENSPLAPSTSTRPYTTTYQEQCFLLWYSAGHPSRFKQIIALLPPDEYGRVPSIKILGFWRDELGWDIRADDLDAKAQAVTDDNLVNARVLMLQEQAAKAREVQKMGMEYLREEGFDTAASAVSAIIKGAELERESRGLSTQITKLFKMNDEKLEAEAQRLLERLNVPKDAVVIDVDDVVVDDEEDGDE